MSGSRGRLALKTAAAAALIGLGLLGAATVTLKMLLPAEKVRELITSYAAKTLGRQVRLAGLSVGPLSGVEVSGLQVSEKPDFKAGTFATVNSFRLKLQLFALLGKRLSIDRVELSGLEVRLTKGRGGKLNVSDLMEAPAAPPEKSSRSSLPFEPTVKTAALTKSRLIYRDAATGDEWTLSELTASTNDLSLKNSFPVEASLNIKGSTPARQVSAKASLEGSLDLSGLAKKSLRADIRKLEAEAGGLTLSLAAKVSADEKSAAVTGLSGDIAGGKLSGEISFKDYAASPDLKVKADLSILDLGQIAAASQATLGRGPTPPPSGTKGAPAKPSPALKTSGRVTIGEIRHPKVSARQTTLSWNLSGITPDLKGVGGWAKLNAGGGSFKALGELSEQPTPVRVLLLPFATLQKISNLGGIKLFPDLSAVDFTSIRGDYSFQSGVMTFKQCRLVGRTIQADVSGKIDLGAESLDLLVTCALPGLAPLEVEVTGTFSQPKTRVRIDKLISQPVSKRVVNPAKRLLQGLFKRKP